MGELNKAFLGLCVSRRAMMLMGFTDGAGMGGALQSVSAKQDAMSKVAGQVLDQAQGLATRVADISSDLLTLQQAGVSSLLAATVAALHDCISKVFPNTCAVKFYQTCCSIVQCTDVCAPDVL